MNIKIIDYILAFLLWFYKLLLRIMQNFGMVSMEWLYNFNKR